MSPLNQLHSRRYPLHEGQTCTCIGMDHVSWSVALVMSQLLIFRPITFLAEFRLYRSGLIPHTLILEKQSQFATRMQKQARAPCRQVIAEVPEFRALVVGMET